MKNFWQKLGQIYYPKATGRHPKLKSHAANPLPVNMFDDVYRVFFCGRDMQNRSSVGAVDIDIVKNIIVAEHYYPFFEHGPVGSFFSDGVSIGNCYEVNGIKYMLFMGWQKSSSEHWRGNIGRLILTSKYELELDSELPFISCDSIDPISLSYPWVQARSNSGFDMWYGSTITWDAGNGEMLHVIKHASSIDGSNWIRNGFTLPYRIGLAQAFSRPTVISNEEGEFEMWFSYRNGLGKKYQIGYAKSPDGINWILDLTNAGILVSTEGWDSEMVEYPFVFNHKGLRYMLYNGNGFGKTGFGLAVYKEQEQNIKEI